MAASDKIKKISTNLPNGFSGKGTTLKYVNKDIPEDVEVIVGDEMQEDFWPRLKIKKWGNESNLSIGILPDETQGKERLTIDQDSGKIVWSKGTQETEFYALYSPDGTIGFEYAINLKTKPKTNIWKFSLQLKNVNFYYQPDAETQSKLLGIPKEHIDIQEHNIGSLEIYSNKSHGKYKTGKVAHLYRPKAIDAKGAEAWCQYNINPDKDGFISVTAPQEFLDNASYPVLIDPTAGFSSVGATAYSAGAGIYMNHHVASATLHDDSTGVLSTDHEIDTNGAHAYLNKITGTVTGYVAIYENDHTGTDASGDALIAESSGQNIDFGGATQYDFDLANATLPAGSRYVLAYRNDETSSFAGKIYGTYVGFNESRSISSAASFPATLPNPITQGSVRYSLWFDYSEAGGGSSTYSGLHYTDTYLDSGPVYSGVHTTDTFTAGSVYVDSYTDVFLKKTFNYPIQASGQYVVDGNGSRIFMKGDTPWHILPRLTIPQIEWYVDERIKQGFDTFGMSLIVNSGATASASYYEYNSIENVNGDPPFTDHEDWDTVNEAYWAHIDSGIKVFTDRGVLMYLWPAYIGYSETESSSSTGWSIEMSLQTDAKMRDYGIFIGNRYASHENVVWVHGGDFTLNTASGDITSKVNAIASGIKSVDPYDSTRLHSAHPRRRYDTEVEYTGDWLNYNSTYTDDVELARDLRVDYLNESLPTHMQEAWYEFKAPSNGTIVENQDIIRFQAYTSLLAGVAGHFYGCEGYPAWNINAVWDFVPDSNWSGLVNTTGTAHMKIYHDLVKYNFVPDWDHQILTSGFDNISGINYASCAITDDNTFIMAYTPSQRDLKIDLSSLNGSTNVDINWINPTDGVTTSVGTIPISSGLIIVNPPNTGDWVLTIEAEAYVTPDGQHGSVSADLQTTGWSRSPATGNYYDKLSESQPSDAEYIYITL